MHASHCWSSCNCAGLSLACAICTCGCLFDFTDSFFKLVLQSLDEKPRINDQGLQEEVLGSLSSSSSSSSEISQKASLRSATPQQATFRSPSELLLLLIARDKRRRSRHVDPAPSTCMCTCMHGYIYVFMCVYVCVCIHVYARYIFAYKQPTSCFCMHKQIP